MGCNGRVHCRLLPSCFSGCFTWQFPRLAHICPWNWVKRPTVLALWNWSALSISRDPSRQPRFQGFPLLVWQSLGNDVGQQKPRSLALLLGDFEKTLRTRLKKQGLSSDLLEPLSIQNLERWPFRHCSYSDSTLNIVISSWSLPVDH